MSPKHSCCYPDDADAADMSGGSWPTLQRHAPHYPDGAVDAAAAVVVAIVEAVGTSME